jgi:phosphoribosylaminoimidazole-succinocarboxamide synthase
MDYKKIRQLVSKNLNNTVDRCWFGKNYQQIKECEAKGIIYTGKVRDSFPLQDGTRAIVVSDNVSVFDIVANEKLVFKGQLLNQTANYWFERTESIMPHHILEIPHPNVSIVKQCKTLPIEMIVRGYITGSGWRDYEAGKFEDMYGIKLPEGLKKNQKLDEPILTPTTKAPRGQHDRPIHRSEAIELIGDKALYSELEEASLKKYEFETKEMAKNDTIFVDTKDEYGLDEDMDLTQIDEIFTSDSSRFWRLSTYQERFDAGQEPQKLDKEILREFQIKNGRDAKLGTDVPLIPFSKEILIEAAIAYCTNYNEVTGKMPEPISPDSGAIIEGILLERGLVAPKD